MRAKRQTRTQQVRIIGGQWRGRRLPVAEHAGLRPSPDRVRETLFNWLAPSIAGARCLDAFAGTGALGLEALSRGARDSVFVERDRQLANAIETSLKTLGGAGRVLCTAFEHAPLAGEKFDVVFLDPPFQQGLLAPAITQVTPWLAPGARVYLEYARDDAPELPPAWQLLKSKQAGQVGYCLAALATDAGAGEDTPL